MEVRTSMILENTRGNILKHRFLARITDLAIYGLFWSILFYTLLDNLPIRNYILQYLYTLVPYFLMILIEPLLLKYFKTTLGKWLVGLYIENHNGERLTYSQGLKRTWKVFVWGQGLHLPVFSIIRYIISYRQAKDNLFLPWESESTIVIKKRINVVLVFDIVMVVLLISGSIYMQESAIMPKHKGNINIAEFADNYNAYIKYFDVYYGQKINQQGQLEQEDTEGYSPVGKCYLSDIQIESSNGTVNKVTLQIELTESEWVTGYDCLVNSAFMAFAAANSEVHYMDVVNENMTELCGYYIYDKSFQFEVKNVQVKADIQKDGYEDHTQFGLIPKEGMQPYYHLILTMENK